MNELIKVEVNEKQEQVVSARSLHEGLGINKDFTSWFKQQVERLNLKESRDFTPFRVESTGGRPSVDFIVPIDIGKHICMISGGEKAWEIRDYFIVIEKQWNTPEAVMARALKIADRKILDYQQKVIQLQTKVEQDKPKVIFAEAVSASKSSILVGELAKLLKQNGIDIGQNRLFNWLRGNGYLIRRKGTDYNMPTQYSMDLGLFEVKETSVTHSDGHISINKTPKATGKGQIYFINKFKGEFNRGGNLIESKSNI